MKNKFICLLVLGLIPQIVFSVPWPFDPNDQVYTLGAGGNYGKYQDYLDGALPYFHDGIDIVEPAGTDVFSVLQQGYVNYIGTGTGLWWSNYQGIDVAETNRGGNGYSYWHMRDFKDQNRDPWFKGKEVSLGDRLGELADFFWIFGTDHLHFTRAYFLSPNNYSYKPIENPLLLLAPQPNDITLPTIEEIKYCKDETKSYFDKDKPMYGDIDIIVNAYDKIPPCDDKLNIYKMTWQITETSKGAYSGKESILWEFQGTLPENVHGVYKNDGFGGECDSSYDRFWYIVTNERANPINYWNTNAWEEVSDYGAGAGDAERNEIAKYHDGNVEFTIRAYDMYNFTPYNSTILLDNFAPYVKLVEIKQDGEIKGDISKPLKKGEATFKIVFSESMDPGKTPKVTFGFMLSRSDLNSNCSGKWVIAIRTEEVL